jgi:hypothetical protein
MTGTWNVFLKEMDWRDDPINARLILALNLKMLTPSCPAMTSN